jgi:LysM repeat protein
MKLALCASGSLAFALLLSNCANTLGKGGNSVISNTGPFDKNGNYIEEWADNPAKWRKSGGPPSPHELKSDRLPEIALNDQPPENSIPLPPKGSSKTTSALNKSKVSTTSSTAKVVADSSALKAADSTKSSAATATRPKEKPATSRYVVKSGDSLSKIASRNRTTVAALKSANGISGTMIHPGQSLRIPRR